MSRSLPKRVWYRSLQACCQVGAVVFFSFRSAGRERVPLEGGALLLANHQSFLDPILFGLSCRRMLNYVARDTLFNVPGLAWLIRSLDAIPIDREGTGLAGLKETLRRLKQGEVVVVFPEGTRSETGDVGPLKPGFAAVARRSKVAIIPAAVDGAHLAWPRERKFPRLSRIQVEFGEPMSAEEIALLTDDELLAEVERRIRVCHTSARAALEQRTARNKRGSLAT
ncbi:MAG: 1-acyl-sn-glycerol-3-phosphate acyltransferase [Pirellulales bacterium]|nr:1-acyl-sn-glycerol-3-phosphate acyltransferase [Pirellulales bacterium]